ncbi:sigma-54-dependent Fis family transcriptional regulator [Fulvimarina endophytica]|uniref:Sigma-54-dependent Fis family transcriptional regulator n=1 Tax=Fulvimarina endophytica TaxID=2293836 RepID=A0A371X2S4_9HYPH|nr:sigma-54-dependent Fis family transcriptional regulator [Fulvimarina endophytica]RFC63530.1 sigma-54-dependent Fis family transcriptional regulator [Fulvimarina endophytica]
MSDRSHVSEIEGVLNGRQSCRDPLVAASWSRCVNQYGMDPARREPAHIVTESELRVHRDRIERLISTARSGLSTLYRQIAGQNYVLLLSDAAGVCVDYFGGEEAREPLREAGLYLGSDWSEGLAGTCAVGTCLFTGQSVTVHQDDHFGMEHTALSCTAAPIYDHQGKIAAVLDISLLRSPIAKSSQRLAMNLVEATARRIELANLMDMSRRDWVLRLSRCPEFLDVDPEAAISLDGSGRILGYTHGAEALLRFGADPETLVGRHLDTLTDIGMDDLPDRMRDRPREERIVRLPDGGALFVHAIAPQSVAARSPLPSRAPARTSPLARFAGPEPKMDALINRAERVARTDIPILLLGETGTGKSRLARAIHSISAPKGTFRTLECAGADRASLDAAFEPCAEPVSLFVRGLEDLVEPMQPVLVTKLRANPSVRTITSTRGPLEGCIRPDLLHRLRGVTLEVPPLRERHDFDWLVERLLRYRAAGSRQLTVAARAALASRPWPGNLRELEHVLDTAVALSDGPVIEEIDLPPSEDRSMGRTAEPVEELSALLDACGWNMAEAARRLGVDRSTVKRRAERMGLRAQGREA